MSKEMGGGEERDQRPNLGPNPSAEEVRAYLEWGHQAASQDPDFMAALGRRQKVKQDRRAVRDSAFREALRKRQVTKEVRRQTEGM